MPGESYFCMPDYLYSNTIMQFSFSKAGISAALTAAALTAFTPAQAQLTVQSNRTALQLAQAITGNGVVVTNAVLNCATEGNGIFDSPNSTIGLDGGIVLSTGRASQISNAEPGVNSSNMNRAGDANLTAISRTSNTYDACVLEFDVVPKGDELKFDYVFASEEYINAVCGPYNDVFAFFISGPGIVGQRNIALVPNTQIPVAVNSVNNGIVGSHPGSTMSNCTGMGAGSPFTQYYTDNSNSSFFAYRGYTAVFTARQDVVPCNTYHLKLAIADAGNALYDSGVLIKSGSLSSTSLQAALAAPLVVDNQPAAVKGCNNAVVNISRGQSKPTAQNIRLQYGGNAVAGTDYTALPGTLTIPPNSTTAGFTISGLPTTGRGDRTLKIYVLDPNNCNNTAGIVDSATLLLVEQPEIALLTDDTEICAGTTLQVQTRASRNLFTYTWSPDLFINNKNLPDPVVSPTQPVTYTLQAAIPGSGCPVFRDSFRVTVTKGPEQIIFSTDSAYNCEGRNISVNAAVRPALSNLHYSWNGPDNFASTTSSLQLRDIRKQQEGWYRLTVTAEGCNGITDSVYVNVIDSVPPPAVQSPVDVCQHQPYTLRASGQQIRWYEQENGGQPLGAAPVIQADLTGTETFYVTQSYGDCESDRIPVTAHIIRCCEQEMFVPTAFTPNGDGLNDELIIRMDPGSKLGVFEVFNRWGQSVYKMSHGDVIWDGSLRGRPVDEGVYYYRLDVHCQDGRNVIRKGELHILR